MFLMIFESTEYVLPTGCWPGGSKSIGWVVPCKPLHRLDGNASPQYKVEWLYHDDSIIMVNSSSS
jgi:hypothetical protein